MTPVPIDLPVRAADAGALAEIIFDCAERRPLREDVRNRVAARIPSLKLDGMRAWPGSLAADPVHPSAYFIAVDGHASRPLLLRMALASTPANPLFPNPLLIGRMRAGLVPEVVVSAMPFGPADHEPVRRFASDVDKAFRPRPLGVRGPFAVASRRPGEVLPGAFQAFRSALRNRRLNLAAISPAELTVESIRDTETAAMWSAIRAGWREGYTLEIESDNAAALAAARGYTTFIAGAEMQDAIVALKAGAGPWKRFDPDAEVRRRTVALTGVLDGASAESASDAILEFAY